MRRLPAFHVIELSGILCLLLACTASPIAVRVAAAAAEQAKTDARSQQTIEARLRQLEDVEETASAKWTLLTRGAESRPMVSVTGHYQ